LFSFDDTKFNDAHAPHEDSDSDDDKSGHDFGSHHQQPPQKSGSTTSTSSQPSFDPFSFEETTNSHDALPTFSTTSNNIFDDPFGGPTPTQQQQSE
jgi:hypothetical protein